MDIRTEEMSQKLSSKCASLRRLLNKQASSPVTQKQLERESGARQNCVQNQRPAQDRTSVCDGTRPTVASADVNSRMLGGVLPQQRGEDCKPVASGIQRPGMLKRGKSAWLVFGHVDTFRNTHVAQTLTMSP